MTRCDDPLAAQFSSVADCRAIAREAIALVRELYPICRSITGAGVRKTLDRLGELATLERFEVPTGTRVFDWLVPREWNVREAWIRGPDGKKVVDFADHNLHLVGYSVPFAGRLSLEELRPHLNSMPDHPDWIPYRTSYYREDWGFCLTDRQLQQLPRGNYDVRVDSTLEPGSLSYAEASAPGTGTREIVIYTHTCHPSLANDNLTGLALGALLARELQGRRGRHTYRIVFGPGTIGSLAWLAANENSLHRISGGLVIGLLGDRGPLTYKRSRRDSAPIDRAATCLLPGSFPTARIAAFEPYGYDERQFCSPGFDLPFGRLTRSPNGAYPEYHSSADNPDLLDTDSLAESLFAIVTLLEVIDRNRTCLNVQPKGEPQLGKRGLYGGMGGRAPAAFEQACLWVLNQSDGSRDLLAIAERSGLPFAAIDSAAEALEMAGLLRQLHGDGEMTMESN